MVKRIAAILFILVCTSVAWAVLGATILARTYSSEDAGRARVHSTWGAPQVQFSPGACWHEHVPKVTESFEDGKKVSRTVTETINHPLPLEASTIDPRGTGTPAEGAAVVGMRFAAIEAGLAQVCYLVLFSYAFFLEGYTGLTITIGAILTLFLTMQMTGRIRWSEEFGGSRVRTAAPPIHP